MAVFCRVESMNKNSLSLNGLKCTLFEEDNARVVELPIEIADVMVVDGPYGIMDDGCPWDDYDLSTKSGRNRFYDYYKGLFSRALPRVKKTGTVFVFNYSEGASIIKSVLDNEFDLVFRRWIAWIYPNHYDYERGLNFRCSHEAILYYTITDDYVFHPPGPPDVIHHPILKASEIEFQDGAKPLEVVRSLLKVVAVPEGTVLSLFAGSGTDLIAANLCRMHSIGFEARDEHVELLVRRMVSYGAGY